MAIEDRLIPYEILVRFGDDGAPRGAHAQYRRVVTFDGEVLKDEPLPAQPLDIDGFPTSRVMSDTAMRALARLSVLEKEAAGREEALAEASARIAELQGATGQAAA